MCAYEDLVNDFGKAIADFVAMSETRQMAQPNEELNTTNINRKEGTTSKDRLTTT